jgi:hypothetical protein
VLLDRNGIVSNPEPPLPTAVMYNGEVTVKFEPVAHRYLVQDLQIGQEWFTPPSVTRVLGTIDKSDALVGWATRCSHEKFTELIRPGVAYDASQIEQMGWQIRTAYKGVLDRAASIGHSVHAWVEQYLIARAGKGVYPTPPLDPPVRSACSGARKWILEVDLRPQSIERILYSRKHRVVGITDIAGAVAAVNGQMTIVDWKSSNSTEGHSYEWQLAAYAKMFEEMTGTEVSNRIIVRLDKTDSTAYPKILSPADLEKDWMGFLGLMAAHKRLKETESIAA